jgi:hypothetical protein
MPAWLRFHFLVGAIVLVVVLACGGWRLLVA